MNRSVAPAPPAVPGLDAGRHVVEIGGISSGVPIAVIGFGFSIITLSLFNIGAVDAGAFPFFPFVAMFTGAITMAFGGIWEARSANVFGATFGMAYACFLVTTGVLLHFVQPGIVASGGQAAFNEGFGAYLLVWAVFTAAMTVGARYINAPAFVAFLLLTVVYVLAGVSNFVSGDAAVLLTRVAGWVGIVDGLTAWYLGVGLLLNGMVGKDVLPMRPYRPR